MEIEITLPESDEHISCVSQYVFLFLLLESFLCRSPDYGAKQVPETISEYIFFRLEYFK